MENLNYGQLMTGAIVTGVQNMPNVQANIEVENGEYVKFPDGSVAKALGEKHEEGGIKLIAPNMTEVLSNTKDLTLTKDMVKKLKKDYNLESVSTNDTYSKVLDKYAKKIGYKKLLSQEVDLFNQVKKNTENALSNGSLRINNDYLSQKIYELQQEKIPLQREFSNIFNALFEDQQAQKPVDEQGATEVTQEIPEEMLELTQEQIFRLGGRYEEFKNIVKKYNTSQKSAYEILEKQGHLPKYPNGGIVYNVNPNKNEYTGINYTQSQSPSKTQYGQISDAEKSLTQLYRNFPTILSSEYYKKFIDIKDGQVKVKDGVKLNKINTEFIGKLQEDMNTLMSSSAEYIVNDNTGKFSQGAKQQAQTYIEKELFNKQGIRDYDAKLGDFTSGRYTMGLDLVTPADLNKISNHY